MIDRAILERLNDPSISAEEKQRILSEMMGGVAAPTQSQAQDPYSLAAAEFAGILYPARQGAVGPLYTAAREFLPGPSDYLTAPSGAIKFQNGVIANPSVPGSIPLFAPGSVAPGSPLWIKTVIDTWGGDKANEWRKKLIELGFNARVAGGIAEKGGIADDLLEGLRQYHYARYNNYGKSIPVAPQDVVSRRAVRGQFDVVDLREQIKPWGQVPFEEDLDKDTADYFADRVIDLAVKLAREHPTWTFEQVEAGAQVRAQKEFVQTPGVKGALKEAEQDEMDDELLDNIVSISQIASI